MLAFWMVGLLADPLWAGGWSTAPHRIVWIALVRDAQKRCVCVRAGGRVGQHTTTATATLCL